MIHDIRLHIEVKIDNQWHHSSIGNLEQNYLLFAKMVNWENDYGITLITPPRGLPDDATETTLPDWNKELSKLTILRIVGE